MSSFRPVIRQEEARVVLVALEAGLPNSKLEPNEIELVLKFMGKISTFDQTAIIFERITGKPYNANELLEAARADRVKDEKDELTEDELYEFAISEDTKTQFGELSTWSLEDKLINAGDKLDPRIRLLTKAELVRRKRDEPESPPTDEYKPLGPPDENTP